MLSFYYLLDILQSHLSLFFDIHAMIFNSITCKAFMSNSTWLGVVGDDPLPSSMRLSQRLVDRQPTMWCDPSETLEILISYFSFFGVYIGNISFGFRLLAVVFTDLYFVINILFLWMCNFNVNEWKCISFCYPIYEMPFHEITDALLL